MKRTALMIALLEVTAATLLYLFGISVVFIFGTILFLTTLLLVLLRRKTKVDLKSVFAVVFASLITMVFAVYGISISKTVQSLKGKSGEVLCMVIEEPRHYSNSVMLTVETSSKRQENSNLCGRLKFAFWIDIRDDVAIADVGDVLVADIEFGEIDRKFIDNYYQDGIFVNARCKSAEIVGERFIIVKPIVNLRRYIRGVLGDYFKSDTKALMNGLMLGDISGISSEAYSDLKSCGMSHFVAVSGLHITIISSLFLSFLRRFLSPRKASLALILPIWLEVAVTGFTPSAVRAGIMCTITFVGRAIFKKTDSLNCLGIAAGAMLLFNPYLITSISFQLSFSATAGVIIASPYSIAASRKLCSGVKWKYSRKLIDYVVETFIISVGALLATLPFSIIYFEGTSVVAPICSVLCSVAVANALSLGVIGALISAIPFVGGVAVVPFKIAGVFADYTLGVANIMAKIPFSFIPIDREGGLFCLALVTALIAVWFLFGKVGGVRFISILISALVVITIFVGEVF